MALDAITTAPTVDDFTWLTEHQYQTPPSFFGGKPVLHLQCPGATIKISVEDLNSQPALADLGDTSATADEDNQKTFDGIDVWVTSRYLVLYSSARAAGVQVAYPTITVHAQEGSAVLLGLNLSDVDTADEDLVFVQLRIIPHTVDTHAASAATESAQQVNGDGDISSNSSQALFKAIADCQELNPDPPEDGEENEFDETAPGATGWITGENMHEFLDENGEFRMPEGATLIDGTDEAAAEDALGAGAGRTRTAAEVDADEADDEAKWQRTS